MKVDFHADNPQKAATVSTYLFTDYYNLLMVGMKIEFSGETYQVNSLHNNPETMKLSHAFVWKYPKPKTEPQHE